MYFDEYGSTLVEIFSVSVFIDGMDDVESADIVGTFQFRDAGEEYIELFKKVEASSSVLPDGTLALTGPSRCIEGYNWGFQICLKELGNGLEICNGQLHEGGGSFYPINHPAKAVITGDHGYVVVNFMRFNKAAQATVEILLNDHGGDEDGTTAVHGHISAEHTIYDYSTAYEEERFKVTMFNVSKDKAKKPKDGTNSIPLSRSVVAVPLGSQLVIKAELFQGSRELVENKFTWMSASVSGEDTICNGSITVKVKWFGNPFTAVGLRHPYALEKNGKRC